MDTPRLGGKRKKDSLSLSLSLSLHKRERAVYILHTLSHNANQIVRCVQRLPKVALTRNSIWQSSLSLSLSPISSRTGSRFLIESDSLFSFYYYQTFQIIKSRWRVVRID